MILCDTCGLYEADAMTWTDGRGRMRRCCGYCLDQALLATASRPA